MKSMKEKEVIEFPSNIKSTIDKSKFKWIIVDYLNELVKEICDDDSIEAEEFTYVIEQSNNKYLLRSDYSIVSHDYKMGGFPVRFYKKEGGLFTLKGFVFIPKSDIDDLCVDGGDMEEMYKSTVTNSEEQVNFNLMIHII